MYTKPGGYSLGQVWGSLCVLVLTHVFVLGAGDRHPTVHCLRHLSPTLGLCLESSALVGAWPITRAYIILEDPKNPHPKQACLASLSSTHSVRLHLLMHGPDPGTYQILIPKLYVRFVLMMHQPGGEKPAPPKSSLFLHPCPSFVLCFLIFDHIPFSPFYFWVIDSMVL